MRQGCPLTDSQVDKIVYLLKTTDMAMAEIATAIGCTRSTVARINRRRNIRVYGKHRSSWENVQSEK